MSDTHEAAAVKLAAASTPGSIQSKNRRVLKAIIMTPGEDIQQEVRPILKDVEGASGGASKELPADDQLSTLTADGQLIEPPFDLLVLAMLQENSTELQPAIEAMEINIDGFGHKLVNRYILQQSAERPAGEKPEALKEPAKPVPPNPALPVAPASADVPEKPVTVGHAITQPVPVKKSVEKDDPIVTKEYIKFTNFFRNCTMDLSFTDLRRRTRKDRESTGNAYWEVIRNPITQEIQGFNHIPSYQIRLARSDQKLTTFTRNVIEEQEDGSPKLVTQTLQKRFRRFVQAKTGTSSRNFASARGYKLRWFKEYRDPRVINNDTGEVVSLADAANLPEEKRASELIHFKNYSPRTAYGMPRYIGNLITIFGDRAAQEINFITLKNNNIPSMALLVSNGQLTEGSIARIKEFVDSQVQGSENYSRMLILEGEGQIEGEDTGHVKIDIKPLTQEQMRDQMFQQYGKDNADRMRRCFRLPPIFLGISQDYTRATADSSRRLADEQVFKPERDEFDNTMNDILVDMGMLYHEYQSNGPNITDDQALISILTAAEKTGGLTPRISREIMSDILGRLLPAIDPEKMDPDIPFSLQLAEQVKNQAAQQTGGIPEVGSQVTALKSVKPSGAMISTLILHRDGLETHLEKQMAVENELQDVEGVAKLLRKENEELKAKVAELEKTNG